MNLNEIVFFFFFLQFVALSCYDYLKILLAKYIIIAYLSQMQNLNKNKQAWTIASEKLLSIYRNQSRYSYHDHNRNSVSLTQDSVQAKPSSHAYQDRLKTLWFYIEKIYFKSFEQPQMMILKQLKDDRIVWNPIIRCQESQEEDLRQFQTERKQIFSQSYLKQKKCLEILDDKFKKQKELSFLKWKFMKYIHLYNKQDILKMKQLLSQSNIKIQQVTNSRQQAESKKKKITQDQFFQILKKQMTTIIYNKNISSKSNAFYDQKQLQRLFQDYQNVKQANQNIIQTIQTYIEQEFLEKLQEIYKYCQVEQHFPKHISNIHIDNIHLYDTIQNLNIIKYLKKEIITLQKRQIAESIAKCNPQDKDDDDKLEKRYYVCYQNAVNLKLRIIGEEQLNEISYHRDFTLSNKKEVQQECEMCHHCKTLINIKNLFKCSYKSSKFGIPTPYPSFHDHYLFNLLKYQERKYTAIQQINSNNKVRNKYIYYIFQNGQYVCNRYYCELCIKAYRPMMKTCGLCPYCQRVCICTRCSRDVYISKLKTMCLYLGQDIFKMQSQSYFLNFYMQHENILYTQDKKIPDNNDRQWLMNNRMEIQSLRLMSNMIHRRQKLNNQSFVNSRQMFYAKLNYLIQKKGYEFEHKKTKK